MRDVAGSWPARDRKQVRRGKEGGKGGEGGRTDGVEETVDGEVGDGAGLGVADGDGLEKVLMGEGQSVFVEHGGKGGGRKRTPSPLASIGAEFHRTVTLGCARSRLAMTLEARRASRRTRT